MGLLPNIGYGAGGVSKPWQLLVPTEDARKQNPDLATEIFNATDTGAKAFLKAQEGTSADRRIALEEHKAKLKADYELLRQKNRLELAAKNADYKKEIAAIVQETFDPGKADELMFKVEASVAAGLKDGSRSDEARRLRLLYRNAETAEEFDQYRSQTVNALRDGLINEIDMDTLDYYSYARQNMHSWASKYNKKFLQRADTPGTASGTGTGTGKMLKNKEVITTEKTTKKSAKDPDGLFLQ